MTNTEKITTASLLSLRAQVDAIVFSMDKSEKSKYDKRLIDSLANIYEKFENNLSTEEFEDIKALAEAMTFRN